MALHRFFIKRAAHGLVVLWAAITLIFLLRYLTPGNPVALIAPLEASEEVRRQITRDLGLNQPIYVQYLNYLWDLLHGDMGYSYASQTSVWHRISVRLPPTLELAFAATAVSIVLSIPFGVISATRRHEWVDYVVTLFSLVGVSTPNFWLGIMLVLVFSVEVGIFPTSGRDVGFVTAVEQLVFHLDISGFRSWLVYITLPAITLGTYYTALLTRLTRSGMLEELGELYISALQAKGLPETLVRYKHALRNTLIPVITVLGLQIGRLIGGTVIVEAVFSWPGLGTLLINSINARDWPLIQGALIIVGIGYITLNFIVDATYAFIDPQVGYE